MQRTRDENRGYGYTVGRESLIAIHIRQKSYR